MKIFQRKGESTAPCGVDLVSRLEANQLPNSRRVDLSFKKPASSLIEWVGMPLSCRFFRMAGCHALSKAAKMLREIAVTRWCLARKFD